MKDILKKIKQIKKIEFEKRQEIPIKVKIISAIFSLIIALLAGSLIFLIKGISPFYALYKIFIASFGSFYYFGETLTKAIPLIIIGTGLALAFRCKFWNIGAEGQLLAGAIVCTYIVLNFGSKLPSIIIIPLMFIGGFIGGAIVGIIPALMKIKYKINEVISTLMLNYIIMQLVYYLIYGPWKGKNQYGFPYTDNFPENTQLPLLLDTRIHYPTLILGIIASILIYVLIQKTNFGYKVKVIGDNIYAAKYGGIEYSKILLSVMIISGGLAGIAGVGEVAGIHYHLTYPNVISGGYGYTAIIVAWLGKLHPLLIILSSIFFAGILTGGDVIQTSFHLPFAVVNIFNGIILIFLIIGDLLSQYKFKLIFKED